MEKIRWAVVGLGYIAQIAVLPGFKHATNAELTALVSDDPKKLKKLGKKYGARLLVPYEEYEALLESGQVDAVYIAVPNHLHRDFTVAAARHGVHVLCEKPMALTEQDCAAMIDAAQSAGVRLMIAYRLHFDEANLEAARIVRSGRLGEPRIFTSLFTMQVEDPDNIRLKASGGGNLYDIGIYCINAARTLFKAEPEEVLAFNATGEDARFREIDEMTGAVLRFPGERLATFTTSFGAADRGLYTVVGTKGSLDVEPAYEYAEAISHRLRVGERTEKKKFPKRDQFGPELVYFSDCVRNGREPEPSGAEGLADVRVIEALLRSARSGGPVRLPPPPEGVRHPTLAQEIRRPPVREPELVNAKPPSAE
jgi:glucose-fructose oxidoreductase